MVQLKDSPHDVKVSDAWLAKHEYMSPEWVKLEWERLWTHVWQAACPEEELVEVGDYVEYPAAEQSIVVIRVASDQIAAYHNACQHRGSPSCSGPTSRTEKGWPTRGSTQTPS